MAITIFLIAKLLSVFPLVCAEYRVMAYYVILCAFGIMLSVSRGLASDRITKNFNS